MITATSLGVRLPNPAQRGWITALEQVDLAVPAGQTTVVVGETGAGKSMVLAALVGLLPAGAQVRGSIRYETPSLSTDLTGLNDHQWRRLRGSQIGWWSQRALFTPTRTIRSQLTEAAPTAPLLELAERCGLPAPLLDRRSEELSGGELRRAAAVSALLHDPPLLLADEPTAGLGAVDVTVIAEMLAERRRRGLTSLVVTHDLGVAATVADTIAVMRAGRVVEHEAADRVLTRPADPYTRELVAASRQNPQEDR